jgi:hypothetical protein
MRGMKRPVRFLCAALCAALIAALCLTSYAASPEIDRLGALGLFAFGDNGTSPEKESRTLTRAELFKIVCLIRNASQKELPGIYADVARYSAFSDAKDIKENDLPYIGYCIANGLVFADENGRLRPQASATYADCFVVILRLLGYPVYHVRPESYPSRDAWQAGIYDICRGEGIVEENVDPSQAAKLGVLANILCAALDMNTYRYDILSSALPSRAMPTGVTLQTKCYGSLKTVNSVIVEVQSGGYRLEDGMIIKESKPNSNLLGYKVRYSACDKNDYLATLSLPVHGQTRYIVYVRGFAIVTVGNDVRVVLNDDTTKTYTLSDSDATILCQQYNSSTPSRVPYSAMTDIILNTRKINNSARVLVIFDADGAIQFVRFYP